FESADFEALWKDDLAVLGDSLLTRQELVLLPASEQRIVLERREGTRFAAVMAIFRDAREGQWRTIKPVSDNYISRRLRKTLYVRLNGNIVEFD
ncbi:MAG: type VI secretion system lipoprotein TssJ, partial [Chromatiales bacterium]